MTQVKLTKRQAGQLGGLTTAHKLGETGRRRRARKGGEATLAKYGRAHYVRMAWAKKGKKLLEP